MDATIFGMRCIEKKMIAANETLDTLGLFCPMPIILTSQKMKAMRAGEVLEVLSDDRGIKQDMPVWCKQTGNELLALLEQGTLFTCYVRKNK